MIARRASLILFLTAIVAGAETRVEIQGMKRRSGEQVLALMGGQAGACPDPGCHSVQRR